MATSAVLNVPGREGSDRGTAKVPAGTRIALTHRVDGTGGSPVRDHEPVRIGLPMPVGVCKDARDLSLIDDNGAHLPLQATTLDQWADGSVRWVLLDFQASTHRPVSTLTLSADGGVAPSPLHNLTVSTLASGLVVDTGVARFELQPGSPFWFSRVEREGTLLTDCAQSGFHIITADGIPARLVIETVVCEDSGPLRAVVRVNGTVSNVATPDWLRLSLRLHFFAGMATVRHEVTVLNPRRSRHAGGYWELGDEGSVAFREVSVRFALPSGGAPTSISAVAEVRGVPTQCATRFTLFQDSSGTSNWNSSNHITASGDLSVQFKGYRAEADGSQFEGLQATPVVAVEHEVGTLALAMQHFWENFPKGVTADGTGIRLSLFPSESRHSHELQGGEQKTHVFTVGFDRDSVSPTQLDWCRRPAEISASPEWYCATGVVKHLVPAVEDPNEDYKWLVGLAIAGEHSFAAKRLVIDEFGWRNFGDLYADHEARFRSPSEPPLVSHYNNQYDAVAGCAYQFFRTGDERWRRTLNELAAHVIDIDIYHTDEDKAAYNHGLFWHTDHYQDAGTASHRTFPRRHGVLGGGPSPDHNYTTGLKLHYFLTGDRASKEAAVGLGQWVINMDDGRLTPFRWLDRGYTGVISVSGDALEHGPARPSGNSLNALLDAHHLTGDRRYLEKAEQLIRRCVHPTDDVDARDLLHAERRWHYTVFLQALGKYLDWKAGLGEVDTTYAYARASLLAYARWMAAHERPFLEDTGRLEHVTETWAAQDMRKSEILSLASKHAEGAEEILFRDRSRFFFEYSVSTLLSMPTHTRTRPLVLLLTNGVTRAYFDSASTIDAPKPANPPPDFGQPTRFVPQKVRARQRAMAIAAISACVGLGTLLALVVA